MATFDEKRLGELLEAGKDAEAKELIEAAIMGAPTQTAAEKAIDYAYAYVEAMNRINARYLESLKETADLLRKVRSAENAVEDSYKVAKLKAEIAGKR